MPGRGTHELAADVGQHLRDRLRVLAPQRLARENHRAGVDVVGVDACRRVGGVDDAADRLVVDALLARVRRERDGRLVQRLAIDDEVAAREVLGEAPQLHAREDHLRAG